MKKILLVLLCTIVSLSAIFAQKKQNEAKGAFDESRYNSMQWRNVGPFRGGRSCAVEGVRNKPNLFYFGATGGGVWKTTDGGRNWSNISDGFFGGSVGAIAVAESDNNVIYVGGGEQTIRGNISSGYGVWKSTDAGKTWVSVGLKDSRNISRIRINPKNPDLVYVAAMGNPYKSSAERGVFRSKDGGKTWEKILFVNEDVGAVDLTFDPNNQRVMFASTWRFRRTPYSFSSGGTGSGLWKTTDAGDTWTDISRNEGLPQKDTLGIIGVTVSPQNSDRIWAQIEAKTGGLFRSDDAGKTWAKINESRDMRQRAWYYTRIYADSKDVNTLYEMNVAYGKSTDGGATFQLKYAAHGDHHDFWIDPDNPKRMIIGDDGGAQTSYDGGETWSTYHNQPTAQFYRVTTDNAVPYRIYVAQQDNSALRIPHRTENDVISNEDFEDTAGGESAHIAVDPLNNEIVYGTSYGGYLTRFDHKIKQNRNINVWPDNPMGAGAETMKYRFQWNFPIFFSPHNPKKLYACSNHLHATTSEGQNWEVLSPDLTRNEASKLKTSGGPITQDNTSVEYYCTIFAAAESPRVKDLIWTGSDDGLLNLTRDGGKNWTIVTPKDLPEWTMINCIEPDPFTDGGAYFAATAYKNGDFKPYIFRTKDYGKTWTKIVQGIDNEHFTRVVRCDPKRKGLLYAGTETGMYISFDDGANWQPFQLNLPIVPITDLAVKNDNLIVATQGRALWIIDDLTPLHQLANETNTELKLYKPIDYIRMNGSQSSGSKTAGTNHPNGVMVHFLLQNIEEKDTVSLSFLDSSGKIIRTFTTQTKEDKNKLKAKKGANLFVWNTRYEDGKKFDGMLLWDGDMSGAKASPGVYKVVLAQNKTTQTADFQILKDPRVEASNADLQVQFDLVQKINDKASEAHTAIGNIRDIRKQFNGFKERIGDEKSQKMIFDDIKRIDSTLTQVEETLYQTKLQSQQDMLNFPIRLTNKLLSVKSAVENAEFRPTDQQIAVANELSIKIDNQLSIYKKLINSDLPALNKKIREVGIDLIMLKK
jgi:photosystem II stability/assembly factor-like uncharacterized protein